MSSLSAKSFACLLLLLPFVAWGQVKGIDVSKYQGAINWKKVAATKKVSYVYIKATEGTTIQDPFYKQNVKGARAAGLPIGSYHLYSSKTTAYQQFANFKSMVKKSEQDLIPVLDIEERHNKNLNMERVNKLLELMEKEYGVKPMIYTSERVYLDRFSGSKYKDYKFFIANYRRRPNARFTLWQYTQTGKISGISGYVDFGQFSKGNTVEDIKLKKSKKQSASDKPAAGNVQAAVEAAASSSADSVENVANSDFDW